MQESYAVMTIGSFSRLEQPAILHQLVRVNSLNMVFKLIQDWSELYRALQYATISAASVCFVFSTHAGQ